MSFYDEWAKLDWGEQQQWVLQQTDADVERALARLARTGKRELADFAALISPAAEKYLLPMTELSQKLTRQRFGNTINMYLPLYLANLCANDCTYCAPMWELACLRWHQLVLPDTPRCLYRRQASSHTCEY